MHMHVHMYMYVHIYIYVYYMSMNTYVRVGLCVYGCEFVYVCKHIDIYI